MGQLDIPFVSVQHMALAAENHGPMATKLMNPSILHELLDRHQLQTCTHRRCRFKVGRNNLSRGGLDSFPAPLSWLLGRNAELLKLAGWQLTADGSRLDPMDDLYTNSQMTQIIDPHQILRSQFRINRTVCSLLVSWSIVDHRLQSTVMFWHQMRAHLFSRCLSVKPSIFGFPDVCMLKFVLEPFRCCIPFMWATIVYECTWVDDEHTYGNLHEYPISCFPASTVIKQSGIINKSESTNQSESIYQP